MMLKCILVYHSITERYICTPGSWTKLFERIIFSFNKQFYNKLWFFMKKGRKITKNLIIGSININNIVNICKCNYVNYFISIFFRFKN